MVGVRVYSASTNTLIYVIVDPSFGSQVNFTGGLIPLYHATSTNNYYEYKEVYIGQKIEEDFQRILTFNLNGTAVHNYVGDYSKFYLEDNVSTPIFLLANNVFFGSNTYSNTIGDLSYNNTATYSFSNNKISNQFYNNTIHQNGFYSNNIGLLFNNNIVYGELWSNTIEENFNSNIIYSEFYDNQIGLNFEENTIGDNRNLGNFNFYRNKIGNDFRYNIIRQNFQNNQIGNQFNNNFANGNFYKNVIGNGFNYNRNIGYDFYGNHIGNGFNNNELIGDYFHDNQIGEYFEYNSISYKFNNNQIGNIFENNTLGDTQYFNWNNTSIENLTARTYNTFYNSLYGDGGQNVGNVILGKELIMHFYRDSGTTLTSGYLVVGETYEITNVAFGGGDFSNVADVQSGTINQNGCIFIATGTTPSSWCGITVTELTVYNEYHKVKFTQWTQGGNGGGFSYERTKVYPTSEPTFYFTKLNYQDIIDIVVPSRLEITRNNNGAIYNDVIENGWNQNVSPEGTQWNSIYTQQYNGSNFKYNTIVNEFKGNYIRGDFQLNSIESYVGTNQFSGDTYQNKIGSYTFGNDFLGYMFNNSWMGSFDNNTFGYNLNANTFGSSISNNTIGYDFINNEIKSDFDNNTIGNGFQTNQIGSSFTNNTIDDNFGYGVSYPQGNKIGNNFYNNTVGEYFYNNSIPDNFIDNTIDNYFQWNIVNTAISGVCLSTGALYHNTTVNVFKNKNGDNRLSYYDESDVLTVETLNEAPCLSGLNALDIPENDLNFGLVLNSSFTVYSTDIVSYGQGTNITANGTSGFDSGPSQTGVGNQEYIIQDNMSQRLKDEILGLFISEGLSTNSTGYVFDVTWGPGSTITNGKAMIGYYWNGGTNYGNIQLSPISTANNDWMTSGQNMFTSPLAAVGTFNFPATFTLYKPIISNPSNWYC